MTPPDTAARLRGAALIVCLVLLAGFAYGPLSRAGFVGEDYRLFHGAHGRGGLASEEEPKPLWRMHGHDFYDVQGVGGAILPGVSISASLRAWGTDDGERWPAALGYRLENLFLLAVGSALVAAFVRRLLLPWTGSEHARSAAFASGLLLFFHPLSYSAVGAVGGRAPILYLVLGAACASSFLKARQDREPLALGLATLAALFASLTSEAALGLPVLVASAEFAAAHRYRPVRARLRTSITTLLLCGAAVQVGPLIRAAYLNEPALPVLRRWLADAGEPGGLWSALTGSLEKLGVLCLPVNANAGGFLGIAAAGVLFLLALQPALRAARTAPRLWGWLLVGWVAALIVTGLPSVHQSIHLSDLSGAREMLASAAVMAVGLGVATTARSGVWRYALPALMVAGYGVLARVNSAPWLAASDAVSELRTDVARARELEGSDLRVVVLDPPLSVDGVAAVGSSLSWVLDRPLTRSEELPEALGMGTEAFLAFAREREFAELRARPSLIILPHPGDFTSDEGERAHYVRLENGEPTQDPRGWTASSRSPELDWDPTRAAVVLVQAALGTPIGASAVGGEAEATEGGAPFLTWRAGPALRVLSARGAWLALDPPAAFFDLGASLEWVLSGRVKRAWMEQLPSLEQAQLLEDVPQFGADVEPDPQGKDWFFPTPELPAELLAIATPERVADGAQWIVTLLDLGAFSYRELPVRQGPSGTLRVPGAAALVTERVHASGGPVAWTLDLRLDGITLARVGGRRIGLSGSREETLPPPRH